MKRIIRSAAALLLSAALLVPTVLASNALGSDLFCNSVTLGGGTMLTYSQFWSSTYSNLRTEHYITYSPGQGSRPVVSYGDAVLTKSTVSSMADILEAEGDRVLTGINGDYFVVATGNPLGLVVTDGILRSSSSYLYAIGFNPDGSVIMGKPDLKTYVNLDGYRLAVSGINKVRNGGSYYLMTDEFSSTTQNTQPGVDVILSPVSENLGETVTETNDDGTTVSLERTDQLKIGGQVTFQVEQVLESTGAITIPEGKYVLTINNNSDAWLVDTLASLTEGDTISIDISSTDTRWNEVDCAVGSLYQMVVDGAVVSDLDDTQNPRTAVGVKPDGTAIFYTIDGRENGVSVGASMTQVAQRLIELGCTEAMCLDGGGSTTLGVTYPDSTSFDVINNPSDGCERSIANAIFLVSDQEATGDLGSYYVSSSSDWVLSGSQITCEANPVDTAWYPLSSSRSVSWSASGGTISSDGVYTAGTTSGVYTITAAGDGASGSVKVAVVSSPDSVSVTRNGSAVSSLSLDPGQTVDLSATAVYKKLTLASQDTSFTWSCDPSVGSITADGVFTAASTEATGSLTVAAGGTSVTVPVNVTTHIYPLASFEISINSFAGTSTAAASLNTDPDRVKYGQQSLQVEYDSASGQADLTADLPMESGESYLSLWVYGDGSGNDLSLSCTDPSGELYTLSYGTLDFTGWKHLTAALPDGAKTITGLTISSADGSAVSGTIWLDQFTTANTPDADSEAPVVSLTVSGGQITAQVSDNNTVLSKSRVSLTLDGQAQDFSWNSSSETLTAEVDCSDDTIHRITVTATDASGNIGRASCTTDSSTDESPFADMSSHWAKSYVSFLYEKGIVTGVESDNSLLFNPNTAITRGEFALMTARWMGLTLSDYSSVTLPFDDADTIPSWCLDAVKAMYQLGVMKGSPSGDRLLVNIQSSISRAEVMTILGRIEEKGYPLASLASFSDASTVPGWSSAYVQSLVGQGVVNGFDGQLRPTASISRSEVAKLLTAIW